MIAVMRSSIRQPWAQDAALRGQRGGLRGLKFGSCWPQNVSKNATDDVTDGDVTGDLASDVANGIVDDAAADAANDTADDGASGIAKDIAHDTADDAANDTADDAANDAASDVAGDVANNLADDATSQATSQATSRRSTEACPRPPNLPDDDCSGLTQARDTPQAPRCRGGSGRRARGVWGCCGGWRLPRPLRPGARRVLPLWFFASFLCPVPPLFLGGLVGWTVLREANDANPVRFWRDSTFLAKL